MQQTIIVYNLFLLVLVCGELIWLARTRSRYIFLLLIFLLLILLASAFSGAFISPIDIFGKIQLLTWALFLHVPVFLIGAAIITRARIPILPVICIVLAACILLIGFDAFILEPDWLEVSHISIPTQKLESPVRVAVVADLQTDEITAFEAQVFEQVKSADPDLILMAGDYLHFPRANEAYFEAKNDLNELLVRSQLEAPLGIYAVRGNVDRQDWTEIFSGLDIETIATTSRKNLGPVKLTGLSLADSANSNLTIPGEDELHIVLGHVPNYSLGQVDADLLIAGHTHGGQVQIPVIGPLFSLSSVPRSWASGMTELEDGKHLLVSRGIGMERGNAPRIRFLCRPELLIIDLIPAQ